MKNDKQSRIWNLELVVVVSENKAATQRYFARLGINELSHV
jgi:hypothetical protein